MDIAHKRTLTSRRPTKLSNCCATRYVALCSACFTTLRDGLVGEKRCLYMRV